VRCARHQERADWDVAAGKRLRNRDEVRLEPPVLECEELPRSAEAGLDLVDAEKRPVSPTELLRALEIAARWERAALPLDRLDDEDGDVLGAQRGLERLEIAE
jgi:hypothetical protein